MPTEDKIKEKFKKAEREIDYGPSSMSVSNAVLANDKKIKEISDKIQKIWNANAPNSTNEKTANKKEKK